MERFSAPQSIDEAVALLAAQPGSFALGGGTDLLVQMRSGAKRPRTIVDLKRIAGIQDVEVTATGAHIGAATSCHTLGLNAELARTWPGLMEAATLIGSQQVQGRASLGGNLCNASPAADSVPALVANRATVLVAGPDGTRRVAVENFCTAPGQTVLDPGEFALAFSLPQPAARTADAYLRFIPRSEMDIAVVGAAVSLTLDGSGGCVAARIALGAVAPTVLLVPEAAAALLGSRLEGTALDACVAAVRAAARPITDRRGTADFRRHVVGVLVRRAIDIAARRVAARS